MFYPAMSRMQMKNLYREHLKEWRPKEYAAILAANAMNTETVRVATKAYKQMIKLMQQGIPAHEAERTVLERYILKKPEPEMLKEWEKMGCSLK